MTTKTYHGSCRCKSVRFEANIDLSAGTTKCNCTWCWKHRAWSAHVTPEQFRLVSAQTASEGERGGFCRECGVLVFRCYSTEGWGDGPGEDRVSIMVSVLDDLDPAALVDAPITYCDGLADSWWNPPAETRHL
jgi:hypothetical protein